MSSAILCNKFSGSIKIVVRVEIFSGTRHKIKAVWALRPFMEKSILLMVTLVYRFLCPRPYRDLCVSLQVFNLVHFLSITKLRLQKYLITGLKFSDLSVILFAAPVPSLCVKFELQRHWRGFAELNFVHLMENHILTPSQSPLYKIKL